MPRRVKPVFDHVAAVLEQLPAFEERLDRGVREEPVVNIRRGLSAVDQVVESEHDANRD
jgi:hypothetical protein